MTASAVGAVMDDRPRASRTIDTTMGPQYTVFACELNAATAKPPPMRRRPTDTTTRDPILSATTAASGVKTAATTAKGNVCTPADRVEYPFTNWEYWVIRKMNPKRQKKATEMESAPPVKRGMVKTRTSRRGPSVRSSSRVNATRRTPATAKHASVCGDVHPHCGPSM